MTPNVADAIPVCGKFINFTSTENTLDAKWNAKAEANSNPNNIGV